MEVWSARHAWCMLCASTLVVAAVGVLLGASLSECSECASPANSRSLQARCKSRTAAA